MQEQNLTRDKANKIQYTRQPITPEAVDRLLQVRKKIIQDRHGKPFEDSTKLIRQMREERTRELMGEE